MKNRNQRMAFTLIELLIVIAVIAVIAAIIFPVYAKVRDKAQQAACFSNARQIAFGLMQYTQDYDESYMTEDDNDAGDPTSTGVDPNPAHFQAWYDWIEPYTGSYAVFKCPSYSGQFPIPDGLDVPNRYIATNYSINENIINNTAVASSVNAIPYPSQTLLVAETNSGLDWFAEFGPGATAIDWIMLDGENHEVRHDMAQTDDFGDPAYNAKVTGVAVDGHVVSMPMDNTNGGPVTVDANGLVHEPGWSGLYATGPTGELSFGS